ncbi:FAD-dependent oxidoreductase [Catellatospora methionotrophica]|uniref:FAD-dependent oxidoreductase n=1 Tax=Catellatospora methionotrophica TaxID=121620 RepID=UPI0033C4F281
MTTEPLPEARLDWPGVVVVGGGVTGLLTALELDRRGIAALVLDQAAACCAQSGQAHGWLHRGGIFPDTGTADVELLNQGARAWARLLDQHPDPAAVDCRVGGLHPRTLDAVTAVWRHLRLPYQHATPDAACAWALHAPERAVVPLRVLRPLLAGTRVALRRAEATGITAYGNTARSLTVRAGQRLFRVRADAFVLAAGAGIAALLPRAAPADRLAHRLSFMLVARSAAAPAHALAIPEQEALGLFTVPRTGGGHRYSLLSNFISYAPTADLSHSRANWLSGIAPTVRRFLPGLWESPDTRWGVYAAVKAEPTRPVALGAPTMAMLPTGHANVAAGVPGKLVLAPLMAQALAEAVSGHARPAPAAPAAAPDALPDLPWGPEEWEITALVRRSTLFAGEAP